MKLGIFVVQIFRKISALIIYKFAYNHSKLFENIFVITKNL